MKTIKPVNIHRNAFNFCKYTIAFLLFISILLQSKIILISVFVILVLSMIFRVARAPLVLLYSLTIEKKFPSPLIMIDENAVLFAHTIGAIFALIALVLIFFVNPLAGWIVTFILALLKTSGAFGFCGAMKLYSCLNNPNGTCCRVGKKIKESR